ncbi:site-specific DNA-methyltransferase [Dehalococcoidia bacterium]|nr:site-specific DNA-methyltransferase [Dehalococcoidia bacterium]MCL0076177.1 site-specific DNA-methyltransferase [Dehalococcoidia bacterium]MCL0102458.1 site-specific DNA-methyltransferase [Dehalococcoidia bacterium]
MDQQPVINTLFSVEETKPKPKKIGKRANKLDGRTWTRYSISIWNDIRKTAEELRLGHPAMFPVQLPMRLIECFTADGDQIVLDPFVGVGSTVLAARTLSKIGVGLEVSPNFVEIALRRLGQADMFAESSQQSRIIRDDARNLLDHVDPESVDMVITSPPYWNILTQKRTADYREIRHYGDMLEDLGKIADYHEFLSALQGVFRLVYRAMKPSKYCIVVAMDLRKKDKFYPYHADIATFMQQIGFIFDDLIIWDRRQEYSNMRPLGYPAKFRINKAHEYILIFQKP